MIREEIRKLIGGYATGSLSEAEKKALFEAALDDQELFDELMREQVLKETLEQLGAKQRLISALESASSRATWRPWAWAGAAATVALAVFVSAWMMLRAPKPSGVAMVNRPSATSEPAQVKRETPAAQPAPAPARVRKAKSRAATAKKTTQTEAAPKVEAAPAAPPADQVQVQSGFRETRPVPMAGAVGGLVPPAPPGRVFSPQMARPNRFGFDYRLEPGFLTIHAAAAGTLRVNSASPDDVVELFSQHVDKESTTRIPLASTYAAFSITFSAQSDSAQAATVEGTRTMPVGAVDDPKPSPNSKIVLRLEIAR